MNLNLNKQLATGYKSSSQIIRVLTEQWVDSSIFCPNCGQSDIDRYPNNRPVADFYCSNCREEYELKSKKATGGTKIVDGAYRTMLQRLTSSNNPNFFLNYDILRLEVTNFLVIPKHFFTQEIIEERKPLAPSAKRAGWVGCNILLNQIPQTGKIYFVRDRQVIPTKKILTEWKKTLFLREEKIIPARNWLLDIMRSIEKLNKQEFTLWDMYAFEHHLSKLHPNNRHVKDKIRQQLQILRDNNYIEFVGNGNYRLT